MIRYALNPEIVYEYKYGKLVSYTKSYTPEEFNNTTLEEERKRYGYKDNQINIFDMIYSNSRIIEANYYRYNGETNYKISISQ